MYFLKFKNHRYLWKCLPPKKISKNISCLPTSLWKHKSSPRFALPIHSALHLNRSEKHAKSEERENLGRCNHTGLTSANGPVVTPRSQSLRDSLTRYALGSLEHVIVLTGELYICTNPEQLQNQKQPELFMEDFFKKIITVLLLCYAVKTVLNIKWSISNYSQIQPSNAAQDLGSNFRSANFC